jgi:hypothetical protein
MRRPTEKIDAARTAGRRTAVVEAKTPSELEAAFMVSVEQKVGGIFIASDPMFLAERKQAERHTVPLISSFREFVVAGRPCELRPEHHQCLS